MKWILKAEVKNEIRENPDLFAAICKVLNKSIYTLPDLIRKNDPKLTQKAVLQVISQHLKLPEKELLDKVTELITKVK